MTIMTTVMLPLALVLAPSHFTAAVLFALFASVVFAVTQRSGARNQLRYGLYCFAMFVGGVFVAGWLMLLLRR
jgi:hypothetical protein